MVDTVAPVLTPKKDIAVFAGEAITAEMLTEVDDVTECKLQLDNRGQDL